ncbi:UNVERIFIED_CONTAM: hypothetical protein GTU68_052144 [Idotea baltica]|nr:hypothetical protein [Idotea baltica]
MKIVEAALHRYTTKVFDSSRKITDSDFNSLKTLLRFSPSNVNSQPWHFIIAHTDAGKERIAKGAQGDYSLNESKILDASHVVLFCSKVSMDTEYLLKLLTIEDNDGRFASNASFKETSHNVRSGFVDVHRFDFKDEQHWLEKQVYVNLGAFLLGASALGIDATPLEGIDVKLLDEEFGLRYDGYTALVAVALGYHSEKDFNANLPKSRLPESEIFTFLK